MKTNSKKGFVIVELVIVIAVIAILAMALIPTFSGLIGTANKTADEMAIREMNTTLKMVELKNMGTKVTFAMARQALKEAGFNGDNLVPTTANCAYYWYETDNVVILVNSDGMIISNDKYDHANIAELDGISYPLANLPYAEITETKYEVIFKADSLIYDLINGGTSQLPTESLPLDVKMTFTALHTAEEAAAMEYGDWYVDYVITTNKTIPAEQAGNYYLAGQYTSFSDLWVLFDFAGIEAGSYQLLKTFTGAWTYTDICRDVQVFNCGIAVPEDEEGLVVKVELVMYETEEDYNDNKNGHVINTYIFDTTK